MTKTFGFPTSLRLGALAAAFLLASCGELVPEPAIDSNTTISGTVSTSESALDGTGQILFDGTLGSADEGRSFRVAFEISDGGVVEIVTHASAMLGSGFSLTFTRSGSTITAQASGPNGGVFSSFPAAVTALLNATGSSEVLFDVHGNEQPLHFLIFPPTATSFSESTAAFNSEADGSGWPDSPASAFNGTGVHWGLELTSAKVTKAQMRSAKLSEE
jgi:hypothetical protein